MLTFIKKYKRTLLIALAVLVLLFAAFIYVATRAVNDLFESEKVTPTASQYSEWVGLWLPENVENFQAYGEGWQDWLVEAKFELSAAEFAEFVERNNLQLLGERSGVETGYDLEWFYSANALEQYDITPLPESASSTPTGFYPTIWIDDSNPEKVIVYIKAFDT